LCFRRGAVCVEIRTDFGGQLSYQRIREGMRILEKEFFWALGSASVNGMLVFFFFLLKACHSCQLREGDFQIFKKKKKTGMREWWGV
jgi:hypothetical protein